MSLILIGLHLIWFSDLRRRTVLYFYGVFVSFNLSLTIMIQLLQYSVLGVRKRYIGAIFYLHYFFIFIISQILFPFLSSDSFHKYLYLLVQVLNPI